MSVGRNKWSFDFKVNIFYRKNKAMFPGHFKIAGHSGTDFKNRKAFKRIKKLNNNTPVTFKHEILQSIT